MSKEIEEIYRDYDNDSIEWMKKHNCMTTKQITIKLMELAQQQKIEQLEKEVEGLRNDLNDSEEEGCIIEDENTKLKERESEFIEEIETLNKIIKEAINLPKGVEPHSYSDYKINKH